MTSPLHHLHEPSSNAARDLAVRCEPRALRTYTPTLAVLARSAGIYHWTPEGRRLYDFTSGVLVANLGHNLYSWLRRHGDYMGWSGAVTGCETDHDRDPRVRFVSFPMEECADVSMRDRPFHASPYQRELEALYNQFGRQLGVLITEPYLGGGGSFHPPKEYLQLL